MPKIIFSFFLISYTVSANVDLECLKWFQKSKNIEAYEWLIKKYSVNFKYKKDCDNGKK